MSIERTTYSGLELIGDIGGLFDGLCILCHFVLMPVSAFAVKAKLLAFATFHRESLTAQ